MSYLSPLFLKFLKDLSKNNTTEWFNEKEVKKPFSDFVEEMIKRIREYEPEIQIKASDAIMRINKDIRFSKDKIPYNTHVAANISIYGKKDKSYPGFYFQLSPDGITIYGGAYMVENNILLYIRNYIAKNLNDFSRAYNDNTFKEKFGTIQGEQNKRIPTEFQDVVKKNPLSPINSFIIQQY